MINDERGLNRGPFFAEGETVLDRHGDSLCICTNKNDAIEIARLINIATEQHSSNSAFGPMGELTGEIFERSEVYRASGDHRLHALMVWAHERVCKLRYDIKGEKWPLDRTIPMPPAPSATGVRDIEVAGHA